jgi:hypothetical protein
MTRNEFLQMVEEAQECRIGIKGSMRYVSLEVPKDLLRQRADELVIAGVLVEFSSAFTGVLYVESGL